MTTTAKHFTAGLLAETLGDGNPEALETARQVMGVAKLAGMQATHIASVALLAIRAGYTGERFQAFALAHGRNLEVMACALLNEWTKEVGI